MADQPKRRTNRPPVDHEDALTERALVASAWMRQNARVLIAGAVVLAVAIIGVLWYQSYRSDLREQAAIELMRIEPLVQAGNHATAIQELDAYLDRFEGTEYGREARVMLARAYLQTGETEQAVEELDQVRRRVGRSAFDAQIELLHADALVEAQEIRAALDRYEDVASKAPHRYLRAEALESAAILHMEAGNHAEAADLYGRMAEQYPPDSEERARAEMRQAEAEHRALES